MDSPLSFEATQNFRKKLLTRNLRPFRDDGFDDGSRPSDGELILDDSSVIDSNQVEEIGKLEGNLQIINNIYKPSTENGSLGDPLNIYTNVLGEMGVKERRFSYPGPLIFSTYSLANLFTNDNPQGSDGSLSQDSDLARISTTQLQAEFQYRIGQELRSETIGRINALDPNNDVFDILSIATGNRSVIERDFNISVPKSIVGKGLDFISRVTGVYSPYSWIEGSFFNYPEKQSFFNQVASAITGEKENKNIEEKDISGTRTRILLENTGKGSKSVLFASLTYNKFVPNLPKTNIIGPQPPQTNFYIGGETSSVKDMIAPNSELPVNAEGKKIQSPVRGYSEVAQEYEKNPDLKIGIASNSYYDEQGSLVGGLTWVSPKYKDDSGKKGEPGGTYGSADPQYDSIKSIVEGSLSEEKTFTEGSILDKTQRLINSGDNISGKKARLQHVSNAMSQISKVFHDGTRELTKGSRVIRYEDENSVPKGYEYCRVFTKDNPFSFFGDLQKTNGNIRDFRSSVFDKTFDLNITPYKGEEVKKYMFSIENLAWRTSQKKGFTYQDLARCERGQNGGRIMWFPPYDMSVSENITANWTSNDFLGRPEPIYTYNNTSRQGSLSWKIIVDHPSILNAIVDKELKNNPDIDKIVDSFIAGCRTYDIYELATSFPQFTFSDIYDIITKTNVIEDFEEITKEIITVTYPEPEEPVYDDPQPIIVEQDYAFNFYFDNDVPKKKSESEPKFSSTNYLEDLNPYIGLKEFYESKAYGEENADEYGLPAQKIPVVQFFNTDIETIESKMLELQVKIREALEKGATVSMDLVGSASSPNSTDYNVLLSERRIDSVKKYFLESDGGGGKTLEQYVEEGKLTINSRGSGEEISVTTLGGKTVDCTEPLQGNNKTYSINAMACRRVRIENIVETYELEPVDTEPEEPDPIYNTELQTLRVPKPRTETETSVERKKEVSKIILKKLLNECDYFERIKEDDPLIYNSIKEKIKFFNPAFHSMTPEGLNSRLTFLQQCMRPGDTIPTINDDGTIKEGSDASNTSFGAPPVCVLRIGDFFNTKIVINSLNINYEPLTFDLNPEGIGVQPMIANIQMSFNFIGGHGLEAPVARLQNALSFNYYANTEMYDDRSVSTAIEDVERLDKKVWEQIENKTPFGLDDRPKDETDDEGGDTIGEVTNKTIALNEQGEEVIISMTTDQLWTQNQIAKRCWEEQIKWTWVESDEFQTMKDQWFNDMKVIDSYDEGEERLSEFSTILHAFIDEKKGANDITQIDYGYVYRCDKVKRYFWNATSFKHYAKAKYNKSYETTLGEMLARMCEEEKVKHADKKDAGKRLNFSIQHFTQ